MKTHNDGGPAFPQSTTDDWQEMNLRYYFAAKAMQGILAGGHPICHRMDVERAIADASYSFADAMIAEREKGNEK